MRHQTGANTSAGIAKRKSPTAVGSSAWPTAWRVATIQPAQMATAPNAAAIPTVVAETWKEREGVVQMTDMATSFERGATSLRRAGHVLAKYSLNYHGVGILCFRIASIAIKCRIPSLDTIDRRIVATLQEDGRRTNVNVADAVGLSPSPCLRRIKRLESEGVIRGYRAVLDRKTVGLGLTVFVEIRVEKHSKENARLHQEMLAAMPEVISCHMVSGMADFLAEVVVPDLAAYEQFLTERLLVLPMVTDVRSNFALREIKSAAPLPLDHLP